MKKYISFIFLWFIVSISSVFAAWEAEVSQTTDFLNTLLSVFSTQVLLRIIFAIFAIVLTFIVSKIARNRLFWYLERWSLWWEAGKEELIWVISRTVNIAILAVWFSITLWILWVDLAIFMWGIWFGIGFTLKTFLTNFIAWIIMVTQWVYHVWDLIEVNGKKGNIAKIDSLFTAVKQFDGVFFYIPNIRFLEDDVRNYHTSDKRRVEIDVQVDYNTDIVKAKSVINKVLENFPILQAPRSDIIVESLGDNGIFLRVRFWIGSKDPYFTLKSNVTETINLAFRQSDIVIPFPQVTLSNRK